MHTAIHLIYLCRGTCFRVFLLEADDLEASFFLPRSQAQSLVLLEKKREKEIISDYSSFLEIGLFGLQIPEDNWLITSERQGKEGSSVKKF